MLRRQRMNIAEISGLLRPIEEEARDVYAELANRFAEQPLLPPFLRALSKDEGAHLELLDAADKLLQEADDIPKASLQFAAADSRGMIETLRSLRSRAAAGQLGETQLLKGIIDAEFSEWNAVFLYVVAHFRDAAPHFQYFASVVQQHRRHIEEYLLSRPVEVRPPNATRAMPRLWEERILVADDDEVLRLVIGEFLAGLGNVSTAADGTEALGLAREKFFDVIVTDIDMPRMTGLELFDAVTATTPVEQRRFIFITGVFRPKLEEWCGPGRAQLLLKPFSLKKLQEAVESVLNKGD